MLVHHVRDLTARYTDVRQNPIRKGMQLGNSSTTSVGVDDPRQSATE